MMQTLVVQWCAAVLIVLSVTYASVGQATADIDPVRISVVYNNVPHASGMTTGWGFAAVIAAHEQTVLFDAGGNGAILLANMRQLGIDPKTIDAVVLSHIHADHTGGLDGFLELNPKVTVYMPESFPVSFQEGVQGRGARVVTVSEPRQLVKNVYSTGEMGGDTREQALIVDTPRGLVVITGCAHPDVAEMAERAEAYLGKNIYLLMGGFHLGSRTEAEIRAVIERLKGLGVEKVAPSHCTGDGAIGMFRDEWGDDFVEGGLGAVIEVPE